MTQHRGAMLRFATMSPEERAKATVGLKQFRSTGGAAMNPELLQLAYLIAEPDERQAIEAFWEKEHSRATH